MPYTVIELINGAYYISGIVSREFQTVQGSQLNDGLTFLNDIIADKTVEDDMVPYYQRLNFPCLPGISEYFIVNLIEIETLVFFINTVRYQMTELPRRQFFGSSRANNIQSLPFTWSVVRQPGGAKLFLYFAPDTNYPLEVWGLFRLGEVAVNQDLMNSLTTVNLGNPLVTGTGTLSPQQLVINGIDLAGTYATAQALATAITNDVPFVNAAINSNQFTLYSNANINIVTSGIALSTSNTVTFQNFSTEQGPLNQTYFPMQLDRFYINYLKYRLAVRLCAEFNYEVPAQVNIELLKYEQMISKRSQKIDLRNERITTLSVPTSLNYGIINLSHGWTI